VRARTIVFVAVTVTCAAVAVGATLTSVEHQREATAAAPKATAAAGDVLAAEVAAGRRVAVFRDLDRERYGRLAFAVGGKRHRSGLNCDRVHFAAAVGVCVVRGTGLLNESTVKLLDARLDVTAEVKVPGVPSRARVSPDGRLAATTTFVTGHSYATPGQFSTAATLIDVRRGRVIADLEKFVTLDAGGARVTARDRNFWGITFADDGRTFYATVAYDGGTHLVRGDIPTRRAKIIHDNVECPSLSPDGTRIGYKKLVSAGAGSPKIWHFTVLDLETMRETPLAEPAPRDDQLEWLDDDQVLYGNGEEIWTVPADGSGGPQRYLAAADSPAVIR
jgi:WD40-like Beta Propeller Repeat